MATVVTGQVGYQNVGAGVQQGPIAQGRNAEAVVTELHGKFYEQTRRGSVFTASQALAGVTLTLQTTTPSNALVNPPGSPKGLSLIACDVAVKTLPATPVVGYYILSGAPTISTTRVTGTALTAQSEQVGNVGTPNGQAFTSPTLPTTPVQYRLISQKLTGAATTLPYLPIISFTPDGSMIIPPGSYVCVTQDAADSTNAAVAVTWVWEEVDL